MNQEMLWKQDREDSIDLIMRKREQYLIALKSYDNQTSFLEKIQLNPKDFFFESMEKLEIDKII